MCAQAADRRNAAPGPQRSREDDRDYAMFIDGEWVAPSGSATFNCVDPYTGESWGRIPAAGPADVDRAVCAARRAFDRDGWPQTAPARRAALLRSLGQLIEEHLDELVYRQVRENGRLISEMRHGTAAVANACYYYAGLAETLHGMTIPVSVPNVVTYTVREPVGVVAAIVPWNAPLVLLGWKLLPALAAGNTVVIKPSEITPVSTLLFMELIEEAGFPNGVVNTVTGFGSPTGEALVNHPGLDRIAFTGSTATGQKIAGAAAARQVRTCMELGGKSPNIIFADADLDAAVNGALAGAFSGTGQSCMAGSRILIEDAVYEQVAERIVAGAEKLAPGDPLDPGTRLGPLASQAQFDRVTGYFDIARTEDVQVLTGAQALDRSGFFVAPTVFGNVNNACRIAREEIFGPVTALLRFDGEEQAVALANDTSFGLAAGVWTENVRRAHRLVKRLRAGTVWVNNYRLVSHALPFGGCKQSGVGREMGPHSLDEFTEVKSVWIDTGNRVHFPAG
jgi:acyl-CoA reductase-like NAD-dependent aldehyde dehydrogenase